MTFRLFGLYFDIDANELADWFGWAPNGVTEGPGSYTHVLWRALTGDHNARFRAATAKGSSIRDLALRYIHRVLTNTIFGNFGSTGSVSSSDLIILNAMFYGRRVNWGRLLAERFADLATRRHGTLVIGGFITQIARYLGILDTSQTSMDALDPVPRGIDTSVLLNMRMIQRRGETFVLVGEEEVEQAPVGRQEHGQQEQEQAGGGIGMEVGQLGGPSTFEQGESSGQGGGSQYDMLSAQMRDMAAHFDTRMDMLTTRVDEAIRQQADFQGQQTEFQEDSRRHMDYMEMAFADFMRTQGHTPPPPPSRRH